MPRIFVLFFKLGNDLTTRKNIIQEIFEGLGYLMR